ncbi:MAG TPA: hypothetical protein VM577_08780 [Anaerovoracaceae bacterium]|nr:hypothetical protein [Anaerovoracaceae bacterium]
MMDTDKEDYDTFDLIDLFYKSYRKVKNKPRTAKVHSTGIHRDSTNDLSFYVRIMLTRRPQNNSLAKINKFSSEIQDQLLYSGFPLFCYIDFCLSDNQEAKEMERIKAQKRRLQKALDEPTTTTTRKNKI